MKRVRMLLRVSSHQQLEADGDLTIQRQLVKEYIRKQTDWSLDSKEYFEGSNSGYKNSVEERNVLQEALQDAGNGEYDILAVYKDDRIGRRMWEIGAYVMRLKSCGVDIYTVKDGCISPDSNDIMGQMMLALRYGNAQKSSADTGARVKDTAKKLVQKGKFMGGCAPYGYKLVLSGEISKHGRALHELAVIPEQAEVVKYIYELSVYKEYGSGKIAQILNEHESFKKLAPRTIWKSGTITSILTNPIYTGHTAYKRRENINGAYHRQKREEWILSLEANENIRIVDDETWNRTQRMRGQRRNKYSKKTEHRDLNVIGRNDGMLALAEVIYCGYCKGKLVNGSKYNYWTIKGTGEKKTSRTPVYQCRNARQGISHHTSKQYRADKIEPIVFAAVEKYIEKLQKNEDIFLEMERIYAKEKKKKEEELKKERSKLANVREKIAVMEKNIPNAMTGEYPFTVEELAEIIRKYKQQEKEQSQRIRQKETELKNSSAADDRRKEIPEKIPAWQTVFRNADIPTKRVFVNHLIDRIYVKKDEIVIRFKWNLPELLPQHGISDDSGVPE